MQFLHPAQNYSCAGSLAWWTSRMAIATGGGCEMPSGSKRCLLHDLMHFRDSALHPGNTAECETCSFRDKKLFEKQLKESDCCTQPLCSEAEIWMSGCVLYIPVCTGEWFGMQISLANYIGHFSTSESWLGLPETPFDVTDRLVSWLFWPSICIVTSLFSFFIFFIWHTFIRNILCC